MFPQRDGILKDLKGTFNLELVTLIDFAGMDAQKLGQVLSRYSIANPEQVAERMIAEANDWKIFLEESVR